MSPRSALAALVLLLGLSACAVPVATGPGGPGGPPQGRLPPQPGPASVAAVASAPPAAAARTFVEVVNRVEPVAEAMCRERSPRLNCDFRILVDDRPGMPANAFQTRDAAGRPIIAFTLALIADVRNADELAFVMSHESAHHIEGHLDRQAQNASLGAEVFGRLAAGVAGGATPDAIRAAQELGAAVGARTYSRDFELEADALGTIIAVRAGYDPLHGAEFFGRIPDPGSQFLGTHPPNAARIAVVRRTAASIGFGT